MSHGVRRVKTSEEAQRLKREKEQRLIQEYTTLVTTVFEHRQTHDYDDQAFAQTTKLLYKNPELYTVWNYRREILNHHLPRQSIADKTRTCQAELAFFMETIPFNPKCYWIWNHRMWVLHIIPDPDWKQELALVNRMLDQDPRNFHGWNYRRYVIAQLQQQQPAKSVDVDQAEFDYTTLKINQNFSNRSAWHNRSKLLPQLLKSIDPQDHAKVMELVAQEYDLVKNAIYTEPEDQCAWLYWRWLLQMDLDQYQPDHQARRRLVAQEVLVIEELLELEPDSQWAIQNWLYLKQLQRTTLGLTLSGAEVQQMVGLIEKLEELDPLRVGRYRDWHARVTAKLG
ncbi:Rab geranylgeranyltransferase [Dispira simplex]|nr:Rab geranylgeranyltransferase [Dispira simplex]